MMRRRAVGVAGRPALASGVIALKSASEGRPRRWRPHRRRSARSRSPSSSRAVAVVGAGRIGVRVRGRTDPPPVMVDGSGVFDCTKAAG